jgi:hypothetical protein
MRVYYFTGALFALSNVSLRRVKVSRFEDLNDPFELLGVDRGNKVRRAAFLEKKKEINGEKGLICFSKSWENPLLWGHYAERHTGVCMGFDVPDHLLGEVIYAKGLLKIDEDQETGSFKITDSVLERLIRTKFADWKYEEEMRLFVALDEAKGESGMYFYPFSGDLALREIILGPRCELPVAGIQSMIGNLEQPVKVLKSRIAFRTYRVVKDIGVKRASAVPKRHRSVRPRQRSIG